MLLGAPSPLLLTALLARGEPSDWDWKIGSRGIEFSPFEDVHLRLGGRIHLDTAQFDPDVTPIDDTTNFRRARWAISGDVKEDWRFFVERDVGGTDVGWKEVWLRFAGFAAVDLTAGNQVSPFSLDELTSSNNTIFMERSLAGSLAAGIYTGFAALTHGENWGVAGGFFGDPLDSDPKKHSNGQGLVGRATCALVNDDDRLLHVGASLEYRAIDSDTQYRIQSRPECGITDVRLVNTGRILDVDDTWTYGPEVAATLGPLSAQGEYLRTELDRDSTNVEFNGWYVQGSYLLTGEHREYRAPRGTFAPIQPASPRGAVEVATRWSHLDLQDGDITGGAESDLTFGLNWYINRNVRLMANYIFIESDPNRQGVDESPEVLEFRLQLAF